MKEDETYGPCSAACREGNTFTPEEERALRRTTHISGDNIKNDHEGTCDDWTASVWLRVVGFSGGPF